MFSDFNVYKKKRVGFFDLWTSLFSAICGLLVLESMVSLGYLVWLYTKTGPLGDINEVDIPVIVTLLGTIGGIFAVSLSVKQEKWKFSEVGVLFNKKTLKEYFYGAVMALLMFVACLLPAVFAGAAKLSFVTIDVAGFALWAFYGIGFMIQSFSEEYLARGFIMKRLNQRYSIIVTLVIQALIFMEMHAGNPGIEFLAYVNLFLIGIIFGQVLLLTDNLMLASGLHWLWNYAQGCIFGVKVSGLEGMPTLLNCEMTGNPLLTGGDFGIEGSLSCTIIYLIVMFLLWGRTANVIKNKSLAATENADTTNENRSEQDG